MKDNRIQLRVDKETKEMIQRAADREGRTLSNYLIHLANEAIIRNARAICDNSDSRKKGIKPKLSIKVHSEGKLALYEGEYMKDWADDNDDEKIQGWLREIGY